MPQWPGFVSGSDMPLSYRADRERTVNLFIESIASKHGPNTAFLRRRPALVNFAGLVTEGGLVNSVDYLLVGAGAKYGTGLTEGGGGGGIVKQGSVALTVGVYPVVIGVKGVASAQAGSSTWNGITAEGGGFGGNDATNDNAGGPGGLGGGAATSYFDGSTWTPFPGGVGTLYNGGNSAINAGAGGAGAGGAGQSATQNNGGAGGPGITSSISGAPLIYGPGGAGVGLTTRGTFATGAFGQGGTGSELDPGHSPIGNQVEPKDGGAVFRYLTGSYEATGGVITTDGAYTIHTFTSSDDFEVTLVVPTVSTTAGGGAIHYCPAQGRCFVISTGGTFFEIFADGSLTTYGTVAVGAFRPSLDDNGTFNQLCIVSGYTVYIFDLTTNVLTLVSSDQIDNAVLVRFSDGYFLLLNTLGVFQWSAPGDGTTWDALDIAKNSATADPWVSILVVHQEVWLLGAQSGQVWVNTVNVDQPFQLALGSIMHQGLIAPFTLQRCDNSSFWIGQNDQGRCVVFRANGYTPTRVSTHAVELAIGRSSELESAIACTFQSQGHTFYQIYVPDIQTSWVYDVSTELWTEWAILVDDSTDPWVWEPWPVQMSTFAFQKNLVVGPDTALVGQLAWDDETGDSPVIVTPEGSLVFTGFGDSTTMRFFSPDGVQLAQPSPDPIPGTGVDGIISIPVSNVVAVVGGNAPNFPTTGTGTFASDWTVAAEYTGAFFGGRGPDRDKNDYFYSVKSTLAGDTVHIFKYDGAATLINSWNISVPSLDWVGVQHICVNDDGDTIYASIGRVSAVHGNVYSFSLAGSGTYNGLFLAMGGLHAPYLRGIQGSDDILVSNDTAFYRYNSSGVLQQTYTLPHYTGMADIAKGLTSASFWVNAYTSDAATFSGVTVAEIDTASGAVLRSFIPEDGTFEFDSSITVLAYDASNLIEPDIRWLRRTPHGVNELKRVYYSRLDLLMDTGVGVGTDPAIFMRYSNDGSQTWTVAREARYGQVGDTTRRVYWTPLGSARDRIFEVYGDSPQPIRIVDAYIEFTPGVS